METKIRELENVLDKVVKENYELGKRLDKMESQLLLHTNSPDNIAHKC